MRFFINKTPYLQNNEDSRTVITECVRFQGRIKIMIIVHYLVQNCLNTRCLCFSWAHSLKRTLLIELDQKLIIKDQAQRGTFFFFKIAWLLWAFVFKRSLTYQQNKTVKRSNECTFSTIKWHWYVPRSKENFMRGSLIFSRGGNWWSDFTWAFF